MDELTMKEISPGDLFSHRRKDNGSISPPPRITTSPSIPTTTIMTNGNSLSPNNGPMDLKNNLAMIMESYSDPTLTTTWHQTVPEYSKPLHVPTPFTIKDILGLADEESANEEENQEDQDDDDEEEEKVETTTTTTAEMVTMMDDPMAMSPSIPAATTPSPQPMSTMQLDDEPLNLTVVKREPSPSSDETNNNNNNRLVNGSGRLFMNRNKSPNNGPLLPNDVIIPKVKHPTNAGTGLKNGTKSKGCGAINLKTSTKRKAKDRRGGPSPKMLAVSIDTTHGDEAGTPTPTHNTTLLSPSLENGSSNDSKKRKKARTTFTGKQIYELERQFEIKKYLSSTERSEMARILNVTEVQVKIWFQNRRTKWKKQDNISNAEAAEHKVMATKGPGSKKDKNSHNHSKGTSGKKTVGAGSGGGGRLPGTSECSFSISGSIDSSDDHSNCASLSEHGSGNTSEGASLSENKHHNSSSSKLTISTTIAEDFSLLQQKLHHNQLQQPLIVPSPTSVLLSHLASALNHKSPDPSLSPLAAAATAAEVELPRRGRSPPISIPHYLFSSTALLGGIQPPVSVVPSTVGTEKEGEGDENDEDDEGDVDNENVRMPEIIMNHQGHDHDDEDQEEEELEENMMQIVEDDPSDNVLVSVCGSSLEKGHVDPEGDCSGSGGECHQGGDDMISDGEEDVEIAAAASVNKDLESGNKAPFGPVSQAS